MSDKDEKKTRKAGKPVVPLKPTASGHERKRKVAAFTSTQIRRRLAVFDIFEVKPKVVSAIPKIISKLCLPIAWKAILIAINGKRRTVTDDDLILAAKKEGIRVSAPTHGWENFPSHFVHKKPVVIPEKHTEEAIQLIKEHYNNALSVTEFVKENTAVKTFLGQFHEWKRVSLIAFIRKQLKKTEEEEEAESDDDEWKDEEDDDNDDEEKKVDVLTVPPTIVADTAAAASSSASIPLPPDSPPPPATSESPSKKPRAAKSPKEQKIYELKQYAKEERNSLGGGDDVYLLTTVGAIKKFFDSLLEQMEPVPETGPLVVLHEPETEGELPRVEYTIEITKKAKWVLNMIATEHFNRWVLKTKKAVEVYRIAKYNDDLTISDEQWKPKMNKLWNRNQFMNGLFSYNESVFDSITKKGSASTVAGTKWRPLEEDEVQEIEASEWVSKKRQKLSADGQSAAVVVHKDKDGNPLNVDKDGQPLPSKNLSMKRMAAVVSSKLSQAPFAIRQKELDAKRKSEKRKREKESSSSSAAAVASSPSVKKEEERSQIDIDAGW